ncbi:FadR/GntR family transcriptional regulator [Kribbella catacumbae]|uniref:FadR/GntR family transcriptional regulator n=1 Tax=Kribbella catacumbae TaxID=460086 RepID=UPI00037E9C57|nr:FadR/GntR family transcriptional regulator [Kribbella catacumbae]
MEGLEAPQRTASLSAQLVDSLRAHIAAGRWPVGSRIPPEHTLVQELQVSRNTLREALRALVHLGLLEARAGDGTYVRASNELESVLVRRATAARGEDVFELRAILEEYAAGLAAVRRTSEDLAELRRLLDCADEVSSTEDMEAIAAVDGDFHRTLVRAGGNELLTDVYGYLGSALTSALGALPWNAEDQAEHARLHRQLVDAVEAGDETDARYLAASVVEVSRRAAGEADT